jgi:hypothetical protein
MFDFLSKGPTTKATTTNQQVGVQGTGAMGASGTIKGAQAVGGSVAIGPINIKNKSGSGGKNSTGGTGGTSVSITTMTTDPQAFAAIKDIAGKSSDVAMQSIYASHQQVIGALSTLQTVSEGALAGNQAIAAQAAPVSEGNQFLASSSNVRKAVIATVVIVGVIATVYVYRRYSR